MNGSDALSTTPLASPGVRVAGDHAPFDPAALLILLAGDHPERLLHVHELPERPARCAEWPDWLEPTLLASLVGAGIPAPWRHQVEVAEAAHPGRHVVV